MTGRPTLLGDRFTGKIHHTLSLLNRLVQLWHLPRLGARRIQLQPSELTSRPLSLVSPRETAAHHSELMICFQQQWNEFATDKTGATEK